MADQVYATLYQQLMTGTRPPAAPLNIATLSRDLEVSQTPIREALARLEHSGLVHREALKGYQVAPLLSEPELEKLMEARLVLEPALTVEAAKHSDPSFLRQLALTITTLRSAPEHSDGPVALQYLAAVDGFHQLIAAQCGNPFMSTAYSVLGGQTHRFRLLNRFGKWHPRKTADEHQAIYQAFVDDDPELAASRMRGHIEIARVRAVDDFNAIQLA